MVLKSFSDAAHRTHAHSCKVGGIHVLFFFDGRIIRQTGPGHPPRLTRKPPECGAQHAKRERQEKGEGTRGSGSGPHARGDVASTTHPDRCQLVTSGLSAAKGTRLILSGVAMPSGSKPGPALSPGCTGWSGPFLRTTRCSQSASKREEWCATAARACSTKLWQRDHKGSGSREAVHGMWSIRL